MKDALGFFFEQSFYHTSPSPSYELKQKVNDMFLDRSPCEGRREHGHILDPILDLVFVDLYKNIADTALYDGTRHMYHNCFSQKDGFLHIFHVMVLEFK